MELCVYFQYWNDYYLQWNTSEYPGVTSVRFPDSQIWKPDILLYNRFVQIMITHVIIADLCIINLSTGVAEKHRHSVFYGVFH